MSAVHWGNGLRIARSLLAERGLPALREVALRGALATAAEVALALEGGPVEAPRTVIIVGHQRSGTTWLHRALASHPEAEAMALADMALPGGMWTRLRGRVLASQRLQVAQDRRLAPLDPIHRLRLHSVEEDEFLLWTLLRSPMGQLDRPWERAVPPDVALDDRDLELWARVVSARARRSGLRHVGKNPHFTWRIPALRQALPGVGVVQLVRHPAQAIASRLSLIRAIWRARFPGFTELSPAQVERIYASSCRCYLGGDGQADLDVGFEELRSSPQEVLARIHARFDLGDPSRLVLPERSSGPGHRYELEEFGLSEGQLARDLAPVYERWGFSG